MSKELEIFRDYRNMLLLQSDWTVMPDSPLSDSKKAEWKTYRINNEYIKSRHFTRTGIKHSI